MSKPDKHEAKSGFVLEETDFMADIVEVLREKSSWWAACEAADEIEMLRAKVIQLERLVSAGVRLPRTKRRPIDDTYPAIEWN